MAETREIPLQIRNLAKNLLYLGQVYADPRDALNEFVSNAADEYVQAGRTGGVIRIVLHRTGRDPHILVSDEGRGMSRERLEQLAGNLCESEKAQARDATALIGEKGIGILAFVSVAEQCDLVSRSERGKTTIRLRLRRGAETCEITEEQQRIRNGPGTDVYLTGIGKETWRVLTAPKLSEYFRLRRRQALLAGDYSIELIEGRKTTPVRPEVYKGIPYEVPPIRTPYGQIRVHLFLWPTPAQGRVVSLVGKGGSQSLMTWPHLTSLGTAPGTRLSFKGRSYSPPSNRPQDESRLSAKRRAFPFLSMLWKGWREV